MAAVSTLLFVLTALLWLLAVTAGVLLVAVLLALAVVLFVPVRFRARLEAALHPDDEGQWDGAARWETDLRWGWFLLRLRLAGTHQGVAENEIRICGLRWPTGKGHDKQKDSPQKTGEKQKKRRVRKKKQKQKLTFDDVKDFLAEGIRLVRRLTAALRLHMAGDLRFGFDDPSLTGLTLGLLAVTGKPADLRVRPEWLEPGVDGWLTLRGKVYGIEVAMALWSAYWRSPLSRRLRQRFTFRFRNQRRQQEVTNHGRAG